MKNSDEHFEQLLKGHLKPPQASNRLRERLDMIPEQFPRSQPVSESRSPRKVSDWLIPTLATAASVMGFMVGFQGVMDMPPFEDTLLTSLFYGNSGGLL